MAPAQKGLDSTLCLQITVRFSTLVSGQTNLTIPSYVEGLSGKQCWKVIQMLIIRKKVESCDI